MNNRKLFLEGSVIVISILFAFGIDAMWDEYKERNEEQKILVALKAEYQASLLDIETVIQYHTDARHTVDEMVSRTDEEIVALGQKRRSEYVVAFCNPWSFYPVLGTTNALIGAGKLDVLENSKLRVALTTFLYLVEDSLEDIIYVGHSAEQVWVAEIEVCGPWTDQKAEFGWAGEPIEAPAFISMITAEELLRVRKDKTLMGLVARCHINIGYYIGELRRLRDSANGILELIEESL